MRRIRYGVAMSLDGYIADGAGGFDWIVMDPEIDFGAMFAKFDTLLMGRRTYEVWLAMDGGGGEREGGTRGMSIVVFSRTLEQRDHPNVIIVGDDWQAKLRELRAKPGKDIWLFGGGELFRTFLDAGLVDGVDVGVIPVLLGGGIPLLPSPAKSAKLKLVRQKLYKKSGIVSLEYDVIKNAKAKRARSRPIRP